MNPANSRRTMYDVSWAAFDLGGLDDVKPDFSFVIEAIKMGSTGNVKLGDRFVGLTDDAKVVVTLRESVRATIQKLMPWASQTAGAALSLSPLVNTDLYTYAQPLVLHPRDRTGQTPATNEDISLLKTVPIKAVEIPRTGNAEDKWEVTFLIYPDRAQLPALVYGTMTA